MCLERFQTGRIPGQLCQGSATLHALRLFLLLRGTSRGLVYGHCSSSCRWSENEPVKLAGATGALKRVWHRAVTPYGDICMGSPLPLPCPAPAAPPQRASAPDPSQPLPPCHPRPRGAGLTSSMRRRRMLGVAAAAGPRAQHRHSGPSAALAMATGPRLT